MLDRLGMTHVQAAAYLGVPITTLSNWLYGHREPNAVAIRLLDVLGTIEAFAPDVHAMFLPPGERRI
jgi:DNA-binding transcriptional regulator YiaG